MVRTSQEEKETACLHPEIEAALTQWLTDRTSPAFLLIGPPGVGKTTMVYRVCRAAQYWIQEFNASHTRTGSSFRQTILPLLTETGVSKWIHPDTPNGRAVLLDEMDGLSQGEKGGLQELLDYLKSGRASGDCPLILICNVLEGRTMQQLLKYCRAVHVGMPDRGRLASFFGANITNIPEAVWALGDLRRLSHHFEYQTIEETRTAREEEGDDLHIAIRAAWFTLFEHWGPQDELDLETKDANLAGLLFHQNLPLVLDLSFDVYESILDQLRWSDRADFWAFFHQCWNLLPLSYRLKLKYPNHALQGVKRPAVPPAAGHLQYTMVLTKQSALFNAWKEANRLANELGIPFRCVTQWASYQTGKIRDTLGLPLPPLPPLPPVDSTTIAPLTSNESHGVAAIYPIGSRPPTKAVASRKKPARGKKSGA